MKTVAAIRSMLARGLTIEQALVAAEIMEDADSDKLAKRREADAARQAAKRDRDASPSRDSRYPSTVTVTVPSRAGARAEPVTTNSSENTEKEKEERKIPPLADLPKAKATGKTLCPEGFEPSERLMDLGRREGLDLPAILRARDEMVSWSRGNGEKRLDWDAVFANWLRRNAAKARASPPGSRAGNGTGFNGKPTLGDIRNAALAAIAARDANGRPNLELLAGPERRSGTGNGDNRPPDGIPRPADGPDGDRGDLLRGLLRVRAFPG